MNSIRLVPTPHHRGPDMSTDHIGIAPCHRSLVLRWARIDDPATVAAELRRLADEIDPPAVASPPRVHCPMPRTCEYHGCAGSCRAEPPAPVAARHTMPDPDDPTAWPLPRAGLEWRGSHYVIDTSSGVYAVFRIIHDEADGLLRYSPEAPEIERVLRAREAARRAKHGGGT